MSFFNDSAMHLLALDVGYLAVCRCSYPGGISVTTQSFLPVSRSDVTRILAFCLDVYVCDCLCLCLCGGRIHVQC